MVANKKIDELSYQVQRNNVFLCFRGPVSQDLLRTLVKAIKIKLDKDDINFATQTKVFAIVVELTQNIINYSDEIISFAELGVPQVRMGTIIIRNASGTIFISSGNLIKNAKLPRVRDRIDKIILIQNNKNDLKTFYKEQLHQKRGDDPESKGAGLGFAELARKSSAIDYAIKNMDEEYSLFSVNVQV